jgi:cytochrome c oxidase assembly protein subunit 15
MYSKSVKIWLIIGLVMVIGQVIIGGITRLTDSGLSITEWEIIKGTLPPLNTEQWESAFEAYKTSAETQYKSLHADMDLREFKKIFFWEYFHRLWARIMGFVFLIPFLIFLGKNMLDKPLLKRLLIIVLLAASAAVFGWIMVASGLNTDNRTWVSAYKLIIHLIIVAALSGYLLWVILWTSDPGSTMDIKNARYGKLFLGLVIVVFIQILFGGLMAGMRAGIIHPYLSVFSKWPVFPQILKAAIGTLSAEQIINYEGNVALKGWVQLIHRFWAILTFIYGIIALIKLQNLSGKQYKTGQLIFGFILITQMILGYWTVIECKSGIPVILGVLHQLVALCLFLATVFLLFIRRKEEIS